MAARRSSLFLLVVVATSVVADPPTTRVMTDTPATDTDAELAKAVVKKTAQFLQGPTGRVFGIQERFQGWIDSLEQQISEAAFNALTSATGTLAQIPFVQEYFSEYLTEESPPSPPPAPVLLLYPQSQPYLYQEDFSPSVHDFVGHSDSLDPQSHGPYLQPQGQTPQHHGYRPHEQGPYLQPKNPFLQDQGPYLHPQDPFLQGPYVQDNDLYSQPLEHYVDPQEPFLQARDDISQPDDRQESPHVQSFPPSKSQNSAALPTVSSTRPNAFVPPPPYIPNSPRVNSEISPAVLALANAQADGGPVHSAIKRLFTGNGGVNISTDQKQDGVDVQPRVADVGNHGSGPYFPDSTVTLVPHTANDSAEASGEGVEDVKSSNGNGTEDEVPEVVHTRRRRSDWEGFSFWDIFTQDVAPTPLYCPSGSVKLLLCVGDQLFDEYIKVPIESARDWVSSIELPKYD